MRIGAHVGLSKGWVHAVDYCVEVGAECFQVFSKSPRTWRATPLDLEAVQAGLSRMDELDVGPVFVHTSYLINPGSDEEGLRARSIDALAEEFRRAAAIGAAGLVTHLGTDAYGDSQRACDAIADAMTEARTASADETVQLLLENTAGAGKQYGGSLEHIGRLKRAIEERGAGPVGVCFDTCHAYAFGHDVTSEAGWQDVLDGLESQCGGSCIGLIHANDCKAGLGEKRDRHAWIGDGEMGIDAFRAMIGMDALGDVPIILEMPGEAPEKDAVNIERLMTLRDEAHIA